MRTVSSIDWYLACPWRRRSMPETGGTDERDRPAAWFWFGPDPADAAVSADLHTLARAPSRADGHVHIDSERAALVVRSCRHKRCRGRRSRRGGMDHHGTDRRPDARHHPRRLAGRGLWSPTGPDRCLHLICSHFPADPILLDPARTVD